MLILKVLQNTYKEHYIYKFNILSKKLKQKDKTYTLILHYSLEKKTEKLTKIPKP